MANTRPSQAPYAKTEKPRRKLAAPAQVHDRGQSDEARCRGEAESQDPGAARCPGATEEEKLDEHEGRARAARTSFPPGETHPDW